MRIAGTSAIDRRVGFSPNASPSGVWRTAEVLALLIGVRPLGRIRGPDGRIQSMVWTRIARAVAEILARWFRESAANRLGNVRDVLGQLGLRHGYGRLGLGFSQLSLSGGSHLKRGARDAGAVSVPTVIASLGPNKTRSRRRGIGVVAYPVPR